MHIEKLELNRIQNILVYRDCDLVDVNVSMMNEYSDLH